MVKSIENKFNKLIENYDPQELRTETRVVGFDSTDTLKTIWQSPE